MSSLNYGFSRRQMIRSLVSGSLLLPGIVSQLLAEETASALNPLAPRASHFFGKAKRVIFIYLTGGLSHVDSFDPKPKLIAKAGEPVDANAKGPRYLPPLWEFKR